MQIWWKKCNSDQWWNDGKCWCKCKKLNILEKDYIWNLTTCSSQNGKYLARIMDDSVIMCDEIIWWKNRDISNKF